MVSLGTRVRIPLAVVSIVVLVGVPATSSAAAQLAAPNPTTWQLNGSAVIDDGMLVLTSPDVTSAASAYLRRPISVTGGHQRLVVQFTLNEGFGSSDGMAVSLLDASSAGSDLLGRDGGALGVMSVDDRARGTFLSVDTWQNLEGDYLVFGDDCTGEDPAAPFLGIGRITGCDAVTRTPYVRTSGLSELPRRVRVEVDLAARTLRAVAYGADPDGVGRATGTVLGRIGPSRIDLPRRFLLGFTGASGAATGPQSVRDVRIDLTGGGRR